MEDTKVIYTAEMRRRPYIRRFFWLLIILLATALAYYALDLIRRGEVDTVETADIDPLLLDGGRIAAAFIIGLVLVRMVVVLLRIFQVKDETVRVLNRGIVWTRHRKRHDETIRVSWNKIKSYRAGARTIRLFGRPLIQNGAQVITTADGDTLHFTGKHGDTRRFHRTVRPFIADATGSRMGRRLRSGGSVKLTKDLAMAPKGLIVGKKAIPWKRADIIVKGTRLSVRELADNGKFRTVKSFRTYQIDNLAGFVDIAASVIQNHQPQRFNIKTQI